MTTVQSQEANYLQTMAERAASLKRKNKRKRSKQNAEMIWKVIDRSYGRWSLSLTLPNEGALLSDEVPANPTFISLFLKMFVPLFDRMANGINTNTKHIPVIKDEHIITYSYQNNTRIKTTLRLDTIIYFFAIRLSIQFSAQHPIRGSLSPLKKSHERPVIKQAINSTKTVTMTEKKYINYRIKRNKQITFKLNYESFKSLHNYFLLDYKWVNFISDQCEKFIRLGGLLKLDEKLTAFRGASPFARFVPNKPTKRGAYFVCFFALFYFCLFVFMFILSFLLFL
jgi:hypothetical protein